MGYAMALTTFRESLQYRCRMLIWVAVCAGRYRFVFAFMAKGTGKFMMFGWVLVEQVVCDLVTPSAERRGGFLNELHERGHMHRMTRKASLKIHVFGVLLVAVHTVRNLAMNSVALVARHISVGTRVALNLITLLFVTCQARCTKLAFQRQIKRGMGIGMAA